jgi:hypothetical protein
MTTRTRTFKNEAKVNQVFYDSQNNPIQLKPGQEFVEDLSQAISLNDLLERERERRVMENDVTESRRAKRLIAQVKLTKSVEELDKLKDGEKNHDVLDAILIKEKELLDDNRG